MSDYGSQDFENQPPAAFPPPPAAPPPSAPPYTSGPQYGMVPPYSAPVKQGNGLGVAGFVTGLLGLIFFWIPFVGLALGLLGVILGGVGLSQGKKNNAPTGLAIAGLVLGVISLVPAIIFLAAVFS